MKYLLILAAALASLVWPIQEGDAAPASEIYPPKDARQVPTEEHVEAGLVSWHADRAAAMEAAKVSGKPVLIFQMLGRLDEEFC